MADMEQQAIALRATVAALQAKLDERGAKHAAAAKRALQDNHHRRS